MKRRGRAIDAHRIGAAASAPGIDPRVWVSAARVLTDDDPIRWDPGLGTIVDVELVGGPLDGTGPIPARVPLAFLTDGAILSHPITAGSFLAVSFAGGDPNELPIVEGLLFADGAAPPTHVNGRDIDAALIAGAHVFVTPHDLEAETTGNARIKAVDLRLLGSTVKLVEDEATQPFVRGTDWQTAIESFADSVATAAAALVPPGPPTTPMTAANASAFLAQVQAAVVVLKSAAASYLSTRLAAE